MKTIEPFTPVQYVLGHSEFCGIDMLVDERVLIPRPETELLVEAAAEMLKGVRPKPGQTELGSDPSLLDLCTGSGAIAIALTKRLFNCKMVASDISADALDVARLNAHRNGLSDNIEFVKSDLFKDIKGRFDLIVSNPPYIAQFEFAGLQKEVLREPRIALDGGPDGLDFYRRIIQDAPGYLKKGGRILFEIGFGQAREVRNIINSAGGFEIIEIKKDFNGIERAITVKWIN